MTQPAATRTALDDQQLVNELCTRLRPHLGHLRLEEYAHVCLNHLAPFLDHATRASIHRRAMAALSDLGVLSLYLADPMVTEVTVNNGSDVWADRSGRMERVDSIDRDELAVVIERITAPLGLRFDLTTPIVDARLADGHRVCAVREPLAVGGTCLSIRRFALHHVSLDAFAPPSVAALLHDLVTSRCNLVVSGATSTGKTTLLNAVTALCDPAERIITIEDTAELNIDAPHVVRLEARPATPDGVEAVTVRQLLHAALRLRPDRLVIGEVRGAEAYDMVQALNTGHDGSLSTVHANGPQDALRRIASLAALGAAGQSRDSLDDQVRSSIDAIVHLARRHDGSRFICSVEEVRPPGEGGSPTTVLATASEVVAEPTRLRRP
jgi:pilus assembly protein CpaF